MDESTVKGSKMTFKELLNKYGWTFEEIVLPINKSVKGDLVRMASDSDYDIKEMFEMRMCHVRLMRRSGMRCTDLHKDIVLANRAEKAKYAPKNPAVSRSIRGGKMKQDRFIMVNGVEVF